MKRRFSLIWLNRPERKDYATPLKHFLEQDIKFGGYGKGRRFFVPCDAKIKGL